MDKLKSHEFTALVIGGTFLAINAGFINVITLNGLYSTTVAHITGNTTKLAIHTFQREWQKLFLASSVIIAFGAGSFVSGFIIGDSKFRLGRSYGLVLLIEAFALFMSFMLLKSDKSAGEVFAAFACGAQNALMTTYSGMVVRTTHMTGIVTDIGMVLGHCARPGMKAETWRLKVLFPLFFGFAFGGIIGKMFYRNLKEFSLLIPCFTIGIAAAVYLSSQVVADAERALRLQQTREFANRHLAEQKIDKNVMFTNVKDSVAVDKEIEDFVAELDKSSNQSNRAPMPEPIQLQPYFRANANNLESQEGSPLLSKRESTAQVRMDE